MSDYERHHGKLIKTELTMEDVLKERNIEVPKNWSTEETFRCEVEDYFLYNGILYKIEDIKNNDEDDYFEAKEIDDEIHYNVRFYNGGCGFHEALELAMKEK